MSSMTVLRLLSADVSSITLQLEARIKQAPSMFMGAPLVIDVTAVPGLGVDLPSLVKALRGLGIAPVGVRGADPAARPEVLELNLGWMDWGRDPTYTKPTLPPAAKRAEDVKRAEEAAPAVTGTDAASAAPAKSESPKDKPQRSTKKSAEKVEKPASKPGDKGAAGSTEGGADKAVQNAAGLAGAEPVSQEAAVKSQAAAPTAQAASGPAVGETDPAMAKEPSDRETSPSQEPLPPPKPMSVATRVITTPIRSGQTVYARDGDLLVLSHVSPGAEIIADGHIHVYGSLRGRALAGAKGNMDARLFCRSLDAELVAVAGTYMVSDEVDKKLKGKPVQVFMRDGKLIVEALQ